MHRFILSSVSANSQGHLILIRYTCARRLQRTNRRLGLSPPFPCKLRGLGHPCLRLVTLSQSKEDKHMFFDQGGYDAQEIPPFDNGFFSPVRT